MQRENKKDRARVVLVAATLVLAFALPAQAQFDSGSICGTAPADTACLGDVTYSIDTLVPLPPDGILQYGTLTVDAGVTVTFVKNALNTPVFILTSGDLILNGSLSVSAPAPATPGGATASGVLGDGNPGDDGIPGEGGPGGFSGGPGGLGGNNGGGSGTSGSVGLGPGGGGRGSASSSILRAAGAGYGAAGAAVSGSATAGPTYGQANLQPLVGGSGGGGGGGGSAFTAGGGGGGGGAIRLASSGTVNIGSGGRIFADGARGGQSGDNRDAPYFDHGGSGGGGSGGAIRVVAESITGNGQLLARGGAGGTLTGCCDAGAGGVGRIRMEANTFTFAGTTTPGRSFDAPGPVSVPNNPTLVISAVGEEPTPAEPTGAGDVTLPEAVAQPVTVDLAATEIPLGTTVTVIVKPANGASSSVISTALDGTLAASTATADVTLPAGPSVIEARADFTLVLSGGMASNGAPLTYDGETIELAKVHVGADGQSEVVYITESGERIPESEIGPLAYAMHYVDKNR